MFGIDDIIGTILEVAKGAAPLAAKQAQRHKLVIKSLKKLKLDPEHPPVDFTDFYEYGFVEYEYGVNKLGIASEEELVLVLEMLHQKEIQAAFREAFDADDLAIIVNKVEKYIEEYALRDEIRDRGIDSPRQLPKLSAYCIAITERTRTPGEVRRDLQLQNLQQNITHFPEKLASLDSLGEIRQELPRLVGSDRQRSFSETVFITQLRAWFEALYDFEPYKVWGEEYFEWIIRVPARRGYDRVLVRGIEGEANLKDINALRQSVKARNTDEGWLVAPSRVSQAARAAVESDRQLFCYSFDELIDETADFSGYLDWLEAEVKRQKIDTLYVPLACTKEEIDPKTKLSLSKSRYDDSNGWIDGCINRWLDDPAKEHISILGEFGTGKTWFVLHYAWQAAQKYRAAKAEGRPLPRLPLVIPMRDYAKAVTVESLFSEFLFRDRDFGLPNYKAFELLNRMGKLLLVFDGFEEMAAKMDRQLTIDNFWELAKVVVPGSKAILTCRTEHFPKAKEGRAILNPELKYSMANPSAEPPQFEVLELEKFNNEQIRAVVSQRAKPETTAKVMANPQLLDLAHRPVTVNLILEALPDIESGKPVDLARIYLYAVRHQMERDITTARTFNSMSDKLYFLCELAWEMVSRQQMSLNYRDFPDRIWRYFAKDLQEQKDLDPWQYDMMAQTLLVRNIDGDYSPAHRSLLEFFVAYKLAAQLGILAPDFAEIAAISFSGNLRETFGQAPLTKTVLDFLLPMLDPGTATKERLLAVIVSTKGKTKEEVGYLGGNAATLLLKADLRSLQNPDARSHLGGDTAILGADFTRACQPQVNFTNANPSESLFAKTFDSVLSIAFSPDRRLLAKGRGNGEVCLCQDLRIDSVCRVRSAHQTLDVAFDPTICVSPVCQIADGKQLPTFQGHSNSVFSFAYSADGKTLAISSDDPTIKLWDIGSGDRQKTFWGHGNSLGSLAYSAHGKTPVTSNPQPTIKLWDIGSGDRQKTFLRHGNLLGSLAYGAHGKTPVTGNPDRTIKLWDIGSGNFPQTLRKHSNLVFSLAYSVGGTTPEFGSLNQSIKLWDIGTSIVRPA